MSSGETAHSTRLLGERLQSKTASKHPLIRDELRRRICRGRVADRLPGVRELAKEFGVHGLTIRKALWALEEEKLVSVVPGKGHFVVRDEIRSVTMLVQSSDLEDGFYAKVVGLLSEKMPEHHLSHDTRLLGSASSNRPYPKPAELELKKGSAIFTIGVQDRSYILELMDAGFRVVALDHVPTDPWVSSVGIDSVAAGAEATRLLLGDGRKDILFIGHLRGGRMDADAMLLETGYRMAMNEVGLKMRSAFAAADGQRSLGRTLEEMSASGCFPDAMFISGVRVARIVRGWCEDKGIRVPEDTLIMSTGQEYSDLPSIGVELDVLCEAALKLLKDVCDDSAYTPQHVLVRARIHEPNAGSGRGRL